MEASEENIEIEEGEIDFKMMEEIKETLNSVVASQKQLKVPKELLSDSENLIILLHKEEEFEKLLIKKKLYLKEIFNDAKKSMFHGEDDKIDKILEDIDNTFDSVLRLTYKKICLIQVQLLEPNPKMLMKLEDSCESLNNNTDKRHSIDEAILRGPISGVISTRPTNVQVQRTASYTSINVETEEIIVPSQLHLCISCTKGDLIRPILNECSVTIKFTFGHYGMDKVSITGLKDDVHSAKKFLIKLSKEIVIPYNTEVHDTNPGDKGRFPEEKADVIQEQGEPANMDERKIQERAMGAIPKRSKELEMIQRKNEDEDISEVNFSVQHRRMRQNLLHEMTPTADQIIKKEIDHQIRMCRCDRKVVVYQIDKEKFLFQFGQSQTLKILKIGEGFISLHDFFMKYDPCRALFQEDVFKVV